MESRWSEKMSAHRREVHDATLDAAAALVAENGLLSITMSEIAEATGIGRATLYKYFPDVEAILAAWHERQVSRHLGELAEVRDQGRDANDRLHAVLEAYALMAYQRPRDTELASLVHRGAHLVESSHNLTALIRDLLVEVADAGGLRTDVTPSELANYCVHALAAAGTMPSKAAVRRLVGVVIAGLHSAP